MDKNKLSKTILIIENGEKDYMDILKCLPESFEPDWKMSIDEDAIKELKNSDYVLCISDVLDIESVALGYSLDSPEVFDSLKKGIKRISKLRQHLDCDLIIVTKIPVRVLRDHLDNFKNDPAMKTLFADDNVNLYRKLDNSKYLPHGEVYVNEKTHIVIKPYLARNLAITESHKREIATWINDFSKLLNKICSLD